MILENADAKRVWPLLGVLSILAFNYAFIFQASLDVHYVDSWAALDRIMRYYQQGLASKSEFIFAPHGSHLHTLIYFLSYLDFRWLGAEQQLTKILSWVAVAGFVFCTLTIMIGQGNKNGKSTLTLTLAAMTVTALLSSVGDWELQLIPFQVVLTLSRLIYFLLLWLLIKALYERSERLYATVVLVSSLAVTFHGMGLLFGFCFIVTHLVMMQKWWRVLLSALPLIIGLKVQSYYSVGETELTRLDSVLSWPIIINFPALVSAYFSVPFRPLLPQLGENVIHFLGWISLIGIGVLVFWSLKTTMNLHGDWRSWRWVAPTQSQDGSAHDRSFPFFMAITGIFIILSAGAAVAFWVTRIGGVDVLAVKHTVMGSSRYASIAALAPVLLIGAYLNAPITMKYWRVLGLAVMGVTLIASLASSLIEQRRFDLDDRLNFAATGLLVGLSPVLDEVELVWPGASNDAYWRDQLPRLVEYLRDSRKTIWRGGPPAGAKGGANYTPSQLNDIKLTPLTEPAAAGRCRLWGNLPVSNRSLPTRSLIAPISDDNNTIVGYGVLTRRTAHDADRVVEGYVYCDAQPDKVTTLFLLQMAP